MAEIRINATGGVKLYDADDSHYAQIVAGTITSNVDAITLGHDTVTIADNLSLGSDSAVLKFGADGDTTLTHTDGTGLTLNSTNKICFNDASQFIQGSSNAVLSLGATDEIDLTATAVDLNGTLNVSGVATFQSTPVFPDGSLALADLDIDGGTDIGAAIVDADLFIVDDGAGGTNRKVTASRLKTYAKSGKILQVIQDVHTSSVDVTDNTFTDTGITADITCSATSSKVLIMVTQDYRKANSTSCVFQLLRDSTVIDVLDGIGYTGNAETSSSYYAYTHLDSPSSTSALTYKTQLKSGDDIATVTAQTNSNPSTITLMEIGA